jgi:hypothetical protein
MSRVLAIACRHEDAIELDWLRHDPLMKFAVGRCPEKRATASLAIEPTMEKFRTQKARGLDSDTPPAPLAYPGWWAREDSNLQPSGYEPLLSDSTGFSG